MGPGPCVSPESTCAALHRLYAEIKVLVGGTVREDCGVGVSLEKCVTDIIFRFTLCFLR